MRAIPKQTHSHDAAMHDVATDTYTMDHDAIMRDVAAAYARCCALIDPLWSEGPPTEERRKSRKDRARSNQIGYGKMKTRQRLDEI